MDQNPELISEPSFVVLLRVPLSARSSPRLVYPAVGPINGDDEAFLVLVSVVIVPEPNNLVEKR
jgi:hypothetical protein